MIELTTNPIDPHNVIESVRGNPSNGAVVSFIGSLRDLSADDRPLRYAECELEPDVVREGLKRVSEEILSKLKLTQVAITHRYGRINIGDTILVVAISATRRSEAFEACQHIVDRVKEMHRLVEVV
jgi:molybdopterin synthase catalytic subunit